MIAVSGRQLLVPMDDPSRVGQIRRVAMGVARECGMRAEDTERVGLIATEMGTNIAKHAHGCGSVLVRWMTEAPGLELIALDSGPGIDDLERLSEDRQSTSGTLGNGLGAIRRLADVHDLYSRPGWGCVVLARVHPHGRVPSGGRYSFGVVSVPARGQDVCGDGWAVGLEAQPICVVIDGLGHGPQAAEAARLGEGVVGTVAAGSPQAVIEALHSGLADSRGGVAAAAMIDPARRRIVAAGVGNITVRIIAPSVSKRLASYPGTLGRVARHWQAVEGEWSEGSVLVMHSDGISQRWRPADVEGLWSRHPSLVAATLFRDHANRDDDCTVAVVGVWGW